MAAGLELSAFADKKVATIGDRVAYTITAVHPKNVSVIPPDRPASLGEWEVEDMASSRKEENGTVTDRFDFILTSYSTGSVPIPGLKLAYTGENNGKQEAAPQPVGMTVESMLAKVGDLGDIRDIKPPARFPAPLGAVLFWLIVIAAALYGLYVLYDKHFRKEQPEGAGAAGAPALSPSERALAELEKLRNSGLVKEGRVKEFYIALSDIVRAYLAAAYSVETLDRTTAEIYDAMRKQVPDKKFVVEVKGFFDGCDLVKFAKYRPDEKACFEDLDGAVKLIR